jgi:hypothetical protein
VCAHVQSEGISIMGSLLRKQRRSACPGQQCGIAQCAKLTGGWWGTMRRSYLNLSKFLSRGPASMSDDEVCGACFLPRCAPPTQSTR